MFLLDCREGQIVLVKEPGFLKDIAVQVLPRASGGTHCTTRVKVVGRADEFDLPKMTQVYQPGKRE